MLSSHDGVARPAGHIRKKTMKRIKEHMVLVRIIALLVVCLFTANTVAWAYPPGEAVYPRADTLQVMSYFEDFTPSKQESLEKAFIFASIIGAAKNEKIMPFQDVNGLLDNWYSTNPMFENLPSTPERVFNVESNPDVTEGRILVKVTRMGLDKEKTARVIILEGEDLFDKSLWELVDSEEAFSVRYDLDWPEMPEGGSENSIENATDYISFIRRVVLNIIDMDPDIYVWEEVRKGKDDKEEEGHEKVKSAPTSLVSWLWHGREDDKDKKGGSFSSFGTVISGFSLFSSVPDVMHDDLRESFLEGSSSARKDLIENYPEYKIKVTEILMFFEEIDKSVEILDKLPDVTWTEDNPATHNEAIEYLMKYFLCQDREERIHALKDAAALIREAAEKIDACLKEAIPDIDKKVKKAPKKKTVQAEQPTRKNGTLQVKADVKVERKGIILEPREEEKYILNACALEGDEINLGEPHLDILFARRTLDHAPIPEIPAILESKVGLYLYNRSTNSVVPIDINMLTARSPHLKSNDPEIVSLEDPRITASGDTIYLDVNVIKAVVKDGKKVLAYYPATTTHSIESFRRILIDRMEGRYTKWEWTPLERLIKEEPYAVQNIKNFIRLAGDFTLDGEDVKLAVYRPSEKGRTTMRLAKSKTDSGPWKDAGLYASVEGDEVGSIGGSAEVQGMAAKAEDSPYELIFFHRAVELPYEKGKPDDRKYYDIRLLIIDKKDPFRYKMVNVMQPEFGKDFSSEGWVKNVIYTTGAVLRTYRAEEGRHEYLIDLYYTREDKDLRLATVTVNIENGMKEAAEAKSTMANLFEGGKFSALKNLPLRILGLFSLATASHEIGHFLWALLSGQGKEVYKAYRKSAGERIQGEIEEGMKKVRRGHAEDLQKIMFKIPLLKMKGYGRMAWDFASGVFFTGKVKGVSGNAAKYGGLLGNLIAAAAGTFWMVYAMDNDVLFPGVGAGKLLLKLPAFLEFFIVTFIYFAPAVLNAIWFFVEMGSDGDLDWGRELNFDSYRNEDERYAPSPVTKENIQRAIEERLREEAREEEERRLREFADNPPTTTDSSTFRGLGEAFPDTMLNMDIDREMHLAMLSDYVPVVLVEKRGGRFTVEPNDGFVDPTILNKTILYYARILEGVINKNPELGWFLYREGGKYLDYNAISDFQRVLAHNYYETNDKWNAKEYVEMYIWDVYRLESGNYRVGDSLFERLEGYRRFALMVIQKEDPDSKVALLNNREKLESLREIVVVDDRMRRDPDNPLWNDPDVMLLDDAGFSLSGWRREASIPGEKIVFAKWQDRIFMFYISRSHTAKGVDIHMWRNCSVVSGRWFTKSRPENLDELPGKLKILLDKAIYSGEMNFRTSPSDDFYRIIHEGDPHQGFDFAVNAALIGKAEYTRLMSLGEEPETADIDMPEIETKTAVGVEPGEDDSELDRMDNWVHTGLEPEEGTEEDDQDTAELFQAKGEYLPNRLYKFLEEAGAFEVFIHKKADGVSVVFQNLKGEEIEVPGIYFAFDFKDLLDVSKKLCYEASYTKKRDLGGIFQPLTEGPFEGVVKSVYKSLHDDEVLEYRIESDGSSLVRISRVERFDLGEEIKFGFEDGNWMYWDKDRKGVTARVADAVYQLGAGNIEHRISHDEAQDIAGDYTGGELYADDLEGRFSKASGTEGYSLAREERFPIELKKYLLKMNKGHAIEVEHIRGMLASGKPIIVDFGCGDGGVARAIADRNPGVNVIALDQFKRGSAAIEAWDRRELESQKRHSPNFVIARADIDIFSKLPDKSLDNILLIHPDWDLVPKMLDKLDLISRKLSRGGRFIFKNYQSIREDRTMYDQRMVTSLLRKRPLTLEEIKKMMRPPEGSRDYLLRLLEKLESGEVESPQKTGTLDLSVRKGTTVLGVDVVKHSRWNDKRLSRTMAVWTKPECSYLGENLSIGLRENEWTYITERGRKTYSPTDMIRENKTGAIRRRITPEKAELIITGSSDLDIAAENIVGTFWEPDDMTIHPVVSDGIYDAEVFHKNDRKTMGIMGRVLAYIYMWEFHPSKVYDANYVALRSLELKESLRENNIKLAVKNGRIAGFIQFRVKEDRKTLVVERVWVVSEGRADMLGVKLVKNLITEEAEREPLLEHLEFSPIAGKEKAWESFLRRLERPGGEGRSWRIQIEEKKENEFGEFIYTVRIHRRERDDLKAVEKNIEKTHKKAERVFKLLGSYLAEEEIPVDVTVDLSLIHREDLEENIETWAHLILMAKDISNVNFVFQSAPLEENMPEDLREDIQGSVSQEEAVPLLEVKIETLAKAKGLGSDEALKVLERVNDSLREGAIEISIASKAYFEWLTQTREPGSELRANQYPVALDGSTVTSASAAPLRNFEAALIVGLTKASLVIAREKDELEEILEDEVLLRRLNELYATIPFDREVVLSKDTIIEYMISPSATTRINLAISLALPPMTRDAIEKIHQLHEAFQLALLAA